MSGRPYALDHTILAPPYCVPCGPSHVTKDESIVNQDHQEYKHEWPPAKDPLQRVHTGRVAGRRGFCQPTARSDTNFGVQAHRQPDDGSDEWKENNNSM